MASETGEVALMLLTLDHESLDEPVRFVFDGKSLVSRGNTFEASYFDFILPDEAEGSPPMAKIAICNVDRQIVDIIRQIDTPPEVTCEVVLASTPDDVEASYEGLKFTDCSYDAFIVEGTLGYEQFLNEPYPGDTYTPATHPAIFGSSEAK